MDYLERVAYFTFILGMLSLVSYYYLFDIPLDNGLEGEGDFKSTVIINSITETEDFSIVSYSYICSNTGIIYAKNISNIEGDEVEITGSKNGDFIEIKEIHLT